MSRLKIIQVLELIGKVSLELWTVEVSERRRERVDLLLGPLCPVEDPEKEQVQRRKSEDPEEYFTHSIFGDCQ